MTITADIFVRLAQYTLIAICTYLFFFGETAEKLRRAERDVDKQTKTLAELNERMDAIEADRIARQQLVPDFEEEVLDMASRLDAALEDDDWDEGMRGKIYGLAADMWDLYADLATEGFEEDSSRMKAD